MEDEERVGFERIGVAQRNQTVAGLVCILAAAGALVALLRSAWSTAAVAGVVGAVAGGLAALLGSVRGEERLELARRKRAEEEFQTREGPRSREAHRKLVEARQAMHREAIERYRQWWTEFKQGKGGFDIQIQHHLERVAAGEAEELDHRLRSDLWAYINFLRLGVEEGKDGPMPRLYAYEERQAADRAAGLPTTLEEKQEYEARSRAERAARTFAKAEAATGGDKEVAEFLTGLEDKDHNDGG